MRKTICLRSIVVFSLLLLSPGYAGEPLGGVGKGVLKLLRVTKDVEERDRPAIGASPSVETLAGEIDWLEHHLDVYGSVVPKQPDVWGQARLTAHRRQVEEQLAKRISEFSASTQAALQRSDIADLSFAIALGRAVDGRAIPTTSIGTPVPATEATQKVEKAVEKDPDGNTIKQTTTTTNTSPSPSAVTPALATFGSSQSITSSSLSLEPVIHNEQLYRYLNALNELRRINDGDDNSDSPGYSLNLVRLPVSILPGKHTQTGYGAEIAITAEPAIGCDLLPSTFKQLVINDLIDLLALPITQTLNNEPRRGSAKLSRLMRAEAEADQLAVKMLKRIDDLQAEQNPNAAEIITFFRENFEYLRGRFLELSALGLAAADGKIRPQDPETEADKDEFVIGRLEFQFDPQDDKSVYKISAFIAAGDLLKTIDELLTNRVSVHRLGLQIQTPDDKEYVIYQPLRCYELPSEKYATYVRGQMPYEIELDFESLGQTLMTTIENGGQEGIPKILSELQKQIQKENTREKLGGFYAALENCSQEYQSDLNSRRKLDTRLAEYIEQLSKAGGANKMLLQAFEAVRIWSTPNDASPKQLDQLKPQQVAAGFDKFELITERLQAAAYKDLFSVTSERFSYIAGNYSSGVATVSSPTRQRRSLQQLSPSQLVDVFGYEVLNGITRSIARTTHAMPTNNSTYIHLMDVRKILYEELSASYDMMTRPEMLGVWGHAGQPLSDAIVGRRPDHIRYLRKQYLSGFEIGQRSNLGAILSWAIVVESSLLNDFMHFEINRFANERGLSLCADANAVFFGPTPDETARSVFQQYVLARWPIHVFALDPVTQDQNIDDQFAMQRNLQLAAAIALAKGTSNLNATANFVRKLEAEMKTIALNRTAVGYSHGQSTFGWRFYPRFQSPDTPSTIGAFGQTLLGGPNRADLLKQRQLEPGIRECTAVVVMPSFVPYLNVHSRSSWFCLNNPSSRELTMKDTMKLSAACEAVSKFSTCVSDSRFYRPGDVSAMHNVITQLSERLPLRSQTIPVPFENSLGGFQLLAGGASALGVELTGWYGAPGISLADNTSTTLFLVGKGFNNLQTQVTVGGVLVESQLLSREIMQVKIPSNVNTILDVTNKSLVNVSIATPYGVSSNLLIPTISLPEPAPKPPRPPHNGRLKNSKSTPRLARRALS